MAGPIKMYAMRQIVRHDVSVELPACMYRLPNIHGAIAGDDGIGGAAKRKNGTACGAHPASSSATSVELVAEQVKQFLKNNQMLTMAVVQQRQEVILQQLEVLKKQMTAIRDSLYSSSTSCTASAKGKVNKKQSGKLNVKQLPDDIALNINPSNPPYSLLLLQKLWKNTIDINIQSYVHSTVSKLPGNVQMFLQSIPETQPTSTLPCVTLRLIWKAIGVNQMELNGPRPIQGEVNLLRYLARLTSGLNYDEDTDMDGYLDTCYNIARSKTKTERSPLFQRLSKKMGKAPFIFGQFSIVDIAAYSAIKQTAGAGEVNAGLTKWMQNCENCN